MCGHLWLSAQESALSPLATEVTGPGKLRTLPGPLERSSAKTQQTGQAAAPEVTGWEKKAQPWPKQDGGPAAPRSWEALLALPDLGAQAGTVSRLGGARLEGGDEGGLGSDRLGAKLSGWAALDKFPNSFNSKFLISKGAVINTPLHSVYVRMM